MNKEGKQEEELSMKVSVRDDGIQTTSSDSTSILATSQSCAEIPQSRDVFRARNLLSELCKPLKSASKHNRTRKTERAKVIISSPYKNAMKEKESKKNLKKVLSSRRQ